jgi:hypothetical protein
MTKIPTKQEMRFTLTNILLGITIGLTICLLLVVLKFKELNKDYTAHKTKDCLVEGGTASYIPLCLAKWDD